MQLVRNHSHWGAFLAEVEGGRVVGVRPFELDPRSVAPDQCDSGWGAFTGAHRGADGPPGLAQAWASWRKGIGQGEGRGREPFVPVSWDKALDLVAGELARVRREHGPQSIMGGSQGWSSAGIFHEARVQLHRFLAAGGGFVELGDELQLRLCAGVPAAHSRQPAGGDRAADLVVLDCAARQADGAVRRRQSEEHAGQQGRLRFAFDRAVDRRAGARRRRSRQHQPDPR